MTCCPHCGRDVDLPRAPAGLTRMQSRLLDYIATFSAENGFSPTYDEMRDHLDLLSKSGVARLVDGLEERGYVSRIPSHARSIRVVAQ